MYPNPCTDIAVSRIGVRGIITHESRFCTPPDLLLHSPATSGETTMKCSRNALGTALFVAAAFAGNACAQTFPTRAVRYVLPLPAGSETDVFARSLARQLGDTWNQQVVVENRPGGGTTIGTEVVAKSPPDGYTLLHAITAHAINATLYAKLPYDPQKDFMCVTQIGNLYGLLLTHPSFPAKNVADLIRI